MNQAYILSGLGSPHKNRNAMVLGLSMAITGIPLVTGQIAGILVMGNGITGPSFPSCFYILSISLYALVFISHLLKDSNDKITAQATEDINN